MGLADNNLTVLHALRKGLFHFVIYEMYFFLSKEEAIERTLWRHWIQVVRTMKINIG